MAIVGSILVTPESGWKKYDDRDSNITYTKVDKTEGSVDGTISSASGLAFAFKFYGTKLRIIGYGASVGIVNIDGLDYNMASSGAGNYDTLIFEKLDLNLNFHTVSFTTTGVAWVTAFHIDDEGELKPYDYIPHYFLIKQDSNYYTIKSTNYNSTTSHNFTPLTLLGGIMPNKSDIEALGFNDLNLLTNSMTVGSETFIPLSKFDNTCELKLYKR